MMISRVAVRLSSTEITQDEKDAQEALLRVERFRKYKQKSSKFISVGESKRYFIASKVNLINCEKYS